MGTLAAALAWAARGFRIFPLEENSKLPIDVGWTYTATTDPEIIKSWWLDPVIKSERNYNIGMLTDGWITADVDTKQGKQGLRTFSELGMELDTLTCGTPSGGFHLIYKGLDQLIGQSPIGRDVDIRSHHGYIVAPGSSIGGKNYEVLIDIAPQEFPEHLRHLLKAPAERRISEQFSSIALDQPEFIELAADWLRTAAPKAIEGQNGDDTTYRVACRVRDFGVSAELALDLLAELWNPSCEPPWDHGELQRKIDNAYRYATSSPGSLTAQASFNNVKVIELPEEPKLNGSAYHFGNALEISEIRTRPWVLGNLLLNKTVTMLISGSGGGKSILKLTIAAHLAMGCDFLGHKCFRPGKSIVQDAEDDAEEMSRRLHAICVAHNLPFDVVKKRICLIGAEQKPIQLTSPGQFPTINHEQVSELIKALKDPEIVFCAIGPLVELHLLQENDTAAMRYVMGVARVIAQEADVAMVIDHHTAKPSIASSEAWVGSQYAGRGSSTIPGAARRLVTLFTASVEDAVDLGVPISQRHEFVRIDDGKVSYGKLGLKQWMRWRSIKLFNGDEVGVLVPHDSADSAKAASENLGQFLIGAIQMAGAASMPIERVLDTMQRDPIMAKEDRATLKNRLQRMLQEPIKIGRVELILNKTELVIR